MKSTLYMVIIQAMILSAAQAQHHVNYPKTESIPVVDELHGFKLTDTYRWLDDKDAPEVKARTAN